MLGTLLASLSGFTQSISDVVGKQLTGENRWRVIGTGTSITAIIAIVILAYTGIPEVPIQFWSIVAAQVPLEILGTYAYLRAIQGGELSLTAPLISLTPAFILLITWFFAIEPITIIGGTGVVLITIGLFILMSSSPLGAFKTLTHSSGRWGLTAALVWSITSTIGKQGVLLVGVVFMLATLLSAVSICCWIVYFATRKSAQNKTIYSQTPRLIQKGFIEAATYGLNNTAYLFAPAAYVIALKRTSTLWSLLWGRLIFKEKFGTRRVLAALIMFSGVLCIVLG